MKTKPAISIVLSLILGSGSLSAPLWAAPGTPSNPAQLTACADVVNEIRNNRTLGIPVQSALRAANHLPCYAQALATSAMPAQISATLEAKKRIVQQSTNRQTGATPNGPGSANAVSQPFSLMSLASEYGGITTSSSNGSFTLQTALNQIPIALAADHLTCIPSPDKPSCLNHQTLDLLQRVSLGTTFSVSSPTKNVTATAVGPAQGNAQQASATTNGTNSPSFSSAFAKVVLVNIAANGADQWAKSVGSASEVTKAAQDLLSSVAGIDGLLDANFDYQKWLACTTKALNSASDEALPSLVAIYYGKLYGFLYEGRRFQCQPNDAALDAEVQKDLNLASIPPPQAVPELRAKLQGAVDLMTKFNTTVQKLRDSLKQPVLTFEYDFATPQNQPSNSVFRLIFSKNVLEKAAAKGSKAAAGNDPAGGGSTDASQNNAPQNNKWTLTANVAASIYNSQPSSNVPGAGRLRDIQAAGSADYLLPSIPVLGRTTLGAAYYFQDQTSPSILKVTPGTPVPGVTFVGLPSAATQVFTQKGDIHVAQLKWGLGAGKNIKFPLAFSYSNRTELVTKPDWRGQFGIYWDFGSLFGGTNNGSK